MDDLFEHRDNMIADLKAEVKRLKTVNKKLRSELKDTKQELAINKSYNALVSTPTTQFSYQWQQPLLPWWWNTRHIRKPITS